MTAGDKPSWDCLQYARNLSICNRMVLEATIPPYNQDMADWHEYLSRDPQICGGALCAKGTRIPVRVIPDSLG